MQHLSMGVIIINSKVLLIAMTEVDCLMINFEMDIDGMINAEEDFVKIKIFDYYAMIFEEVVGIDDYYATIKQVLLKLALARPVSLIVN